MFVLKIDLPTGTAYFTGKKKVVQGSESPGLTDLLSSAKLFESEEEAEKFCRMLIKRYDMEFYYSDLREAGADAQENVKEDTEE